jgi:hypothetical protein
VYRRKGELDDSTNRPSTSVTSCSPCRPLFCSLQIDTSSKCSIRSSRHRNARTRPTLSVRPVDVQIGSIILRIFFTRVRCANENLTQARTLISAKLTQQQQQLKLMRSRPHHRFYSRMLTAKCTDKIPSVFWYPEFLLNRRRC